MNFWTSLTVLLDRHNHKLLPGINADSLNVRPNEIWPNLTVLTHKKNCEWNKIERSVFQPFDDKCVNWSSHLKTFDFVLFGSEIELTKKKFCLISFDNRTRSNLIVRLILMKILFDIAQCYARRITKDKKLTTLP